MQYWHVLKHFCPSKSLKVFLGHFQSHSKSGLFYKNHQSKVMQSSKVND